MAMGAMPWFFLATLVQLAVSSTIDTYITSRRQASQCLSNAVPVSQRRTLLTSSGDFFLGVYNLIDARLHPNQVDAPTAIFTILAEEVLGYHVQIMSDWASDPRRLPEEALHSLGGCERNELFQWICGGHGGRRTLVHVGLGLTGFTGATSSVQQKFDELQRLRVGGLFQDLGDMGYIVRQGIYVKRQVAIRALADRIFLDDVRSFNAGKQDYFNLTSYFSNLSEVTVELRPCEWWFFSPEDWESYPSLLNSTGNDANMTVNNVTLQRVPQCWNNWWLSKACRHDPGSCLPLITQIINGYVNLAVTLMDKATRLNMPIALGALEGHTRDSTFYDAVNRFDVLYFFWEPDVIFRLLNPVLVAPLDAGVQEPRVVVSSSLEWLAPDAFVLLDRLRFTLENIYEMMSYTDPAPVSASPAPSSNSSDPFEGISEVASPNSWFMGDVFDGACAWIQNNANTWGAWVPDKTSCMPGQGLFLNGTWIVEWNVLANSSECRVCVPGRFSIQIPKNANDDTAVCRQCDPGTISPAFNAEACQACPAGTIADSAGMSACTKCPQGFYQDTVGAVSCKSCANLQTTPQGARSASDCVCQPGTMTDPRDPTAPCWVCPEGVTCENGQAIQQEGYWVEAPDAEVLNHNLTADQVLSVFRCRDRLQCPGGELGSCAFGREGRACGSCMAGHAPEFNGTCAACGGRSLWPILLMLLVTLGAIPLILVAGIFVARARRAALSLFMVSIIFGQVVVCLQALDAIYQLDITWIDPAKAILQSLAIFNLDLDFSCVLPPQDYILEYVVQLTAYPVVLVCTFLVWLAMKGVARKYVTFNAFVNVHGLLLVALLTALTLTVVRPLQCKINPNGHCTIATRPDIICWESSEHQTLVLLATAGIVAYPVTILVSIMYLTRKYPIWLRSGGGIEVMERYRFLFARFRPERYYYGLILSLHNLIVAVIPSALALYPALQVGIMGIVICVKMIIQILIWPWRLELANYNDLALSAGLLILLLLASPLLDLSQEETLTFVAILLSSVMVVLPVVALFAALAVVFSRLRPQSKYAAFLCHHKCGAGALCRFFKLVAKKYVNMNIFLDSDELDDLARIFDVVRADTKCLVVVLTSELLNRMWCAGEIASAHKNQVPIIPLYCDDYAFPDNDSIDVVESAWTEEQRQTLVSYGISMEDIKAAYKYMSKLRSFSLCRSWTLEEQEERVLQVVQESYSCTPSRQHKVLPSSVSGARILVCVQQVPEAISTGLILQQMVQLELRSATYSLRAVEEVADATKASFVVFLLSKGVLEDVLFARCLLACRQRSLEFVPVNDGSFQFPLPDFVSEVETGRHEVFATLSPNLGPLLGKAYQALLSILALPLTPHGSSGILERQVAQICQRFGSLEDEPRMTKNNSELEKVDSSPELRVPKENAEENGVAGIDLEVDVKRVKSFDSDDLWHI